LQVAWMFVLYSTGNSTIRTKKEVRKNSIQRENKRRDWENKKKIPTGETKCFLVQIVQTDSGAHTCSCSTGTATWS
jgi:hypothetical protein